MGGWRCPVPKMKRERTRNEGAAFGFRTAWFAAALKVVILPAPALAAESLFGDLPADIVKARPSASVPAELPGSRFEPCAVGPGVRVFVPMRGAVVDVDPARRAGAGSGCAGTPAAPLPGPAGERLSGDAEE